MGKAPLFVALKRQDAYNVTDCIKKPKGEERMEPIRILQVVPAMNTGGMETFIMNLYRAMDREKVQ